MAHMTDINLERETTIVFNEAEDHASLWSASPLFQRKMERLGIAPTRIAERERGQISCWYEVPRSWIKVKLPIRRQLTEEQRNKMADTARRTFSKRLGQPHDVLSRETDLKNESDAAA